MDIVILALAALLAAMGLGVMRRWKRPGGRLLSYSVLVACRNEERNLPRLLDSLAAIDYPPALIEFILVDDASTDGTLALLRDWCETRPNAQAIHLATKDPEWRGKKAALREAAAAARHDILLFTDADCRVPAGWAAGYNDYFASGVGFVVGYSPEEGVGPFRRFSQLVSTGVIAAMTGLGAPFSAIGRNMAVRRSAFEQVGGYESIRHHVSGDDKLLLKLVSRVGHKVAYNPQNPVFTLPDRMTQKQQNLRRYGKFAMSRMLIQLLDLFVVAAYAWLPVQAVRGGAWPSIIIWFGASMLLWAAVLVKHRARMHPLDPLYLVVFPYWMIVWAIWGVFGRWEWRK